MMVPALGIVSTYFNRRRAFAIGIVTTGSSIGGIVYPILIRLLLEKLGFHWAMRILAFVVLGTLAIGCIMLKQREDIVLIRKREAAEKKGKGGPSTLQIILKDWAYLSFVLGMFWTCLGLYSPFFYIEEYTVLGGLDLKGLDSFYLVSIMNAGGAMGRIVPGIIADA